MVVGCVRNTKIRCRAVEVSGMGEMIICTRLKWSIVPHCQVLPRQSSDCTPNGTVTSFAVYFDMDEELGMYLSIFAFDSRSNLRSIFHFSYPLTSSQPDQIMPRNKAIIQNADSRFLGPTRSISSVPVPYVVVYPVSSDLVSIFVSSSITCLHSQGSFCDFPATLLPH